MLLQNHQGNRLDLEIYDKETHFSKHGKQAGVLSGSFPIKQCNVNFMWIHLFTRMYNISRHVAIKHFSIQKNIKRWQTVVPIEWLDLNLGKVPQTR